MKEAAAELNVATRTIAFHKYQIMEEHGLKNNSDLVRFAMKQQVAVADEITPDRVIGSTQSSFRHADNNGIPTCRPIPPDHFASPD